MSWRKHAISSLQAILVQTVILVCIVIAMKMVPQDFRSVVWLPFGLLCYWSVVQSHTWLEFDEEFKGPNKNRIDKNSIWLLGGIGIFAPMFLKDFMFRVPENWSVFGGFAWLWLGECLILNLLSNREYPSAYRTNSVIYFGFVYFTILCALHWEKLPFPLL